MRLAAAAILLLAFFFPVPAKAQSFSDNYPQAEHWFGNVIAPAASARTIKGYKAASASRSCLTAATRAVLDRLEARFGAVKVISTCRKGAVIAGSGGKPSYHRYGKAVDFDVPRGVNKRDMVRWLYANNKGLVMTYARMNHIHFDTGSYHKIACGGCGKSKARRAYAAAR